MNIGNIKTIGSGQFVYMAMMEESVYQVKIGHTRKPLSRELSLFNAGVPAPYHMLHIWEVHDMIHVERNVIHPWLSNFRNDYGKEIFHLNDKYPELIDTNIWPTANGLILASKLAEDINAYLDELSIAYQRVWYDDLVR
ncbi:GIY-YIG nuclease family protein [Janthinobacterium lividum]